MLQPLGGALNSVEGGRSTVQAAPQLLPQGALGGLLIGWHKQGPRGS